MVNRVEILQNVNLFDEAFLLLYYWANRDDMDAKKAEFSVYYQDDIDSYSKKIDCIIEMYQYVKNNLKIEKEKMEYYFKERNSNLFTFGTLALLWEMQIEGSNNQLPSYEEYFRNITEEMRVKKFASIINWEEAMVTSDDKLKTLTDLINFIEASPFDKDTKWEIIKIFNNQETFYNELKRILTETTNLLYHKYSMQIADICQKFYQYWTNYQKTGDILFDIESKSNLSWKNKSKGVIVAPMIFIPFDIALSVDKTENRRKDIVRLSVMLDKRLERVSRRVSKDDIIKFGKLLCDRSKVDILDYISRKPAYGKELANVLNLSTATISYHVNTLLDMGLVKATVDANRMYYSIDRDRIEYYLEDIMKYFNELYDNCCY